MKRLKGMPLLAAFFLCSVSIFMPAVGKADCRNPELRKKVTETAKAEGVNENELLSIIAHESGCRYYTIAWNLPRRPKTAQSKFLSSEQEAKTLAESLIATKSFRVDVGIGQINNEAHIRPKGWTLEEVLNPATALNRVAQVLKERGWKNYHSNNPVLAERWKKAAIAALDQVSSKQTGKSNFIETPIRKSSPLIAFKASGSMTTKKEGLDWVIFGR